MCDIIKCKSECNSISNDDGIDVWERCKNCPIAGPAYKCNYTTIPKKLECPTKCNEKKCTKLDSIRDALYECGGCTNSTESNGCYKDSVEFTKIEDEFKHRLKLANEETIYEKYNTQQSTGLINNTITNPINNSDVITNPTQLLEATKMKTPAEILEATKMIGN